MRAVTLPSTSNGPIEVLADAGLRAILPTRTARCSAATVSRSWDTTWMSPPSLPATGRGVVTTRAARRAMSQASSEAMAFFE